MLAAAGGAVAATASHGGGSSARTLVATQRLVSVPAVTSTGKTVRPARTAKPTRSTRTLIPWPGTGYTIVLVSIPTSRGAGVAKRRALDALEAGLPQVGVLVSSSYAGLHPGYFIVFSGVYGTLDEAQSALPDARPAFPGAYARLVTR